MRRTGDDVEARWWGLHASCVAQLRRDQPHAGGLDRRAREGSVGQRRRQVARALLREGLPPAHHSAGAWAALGYLAIIATALAYLLFYRIIARVGAGQASLVTLMVAPVSILLGAWLLGEVLPLRAYLGFALLVAGLVILDGRLLRRQRPAVTLSEPGSP